MTAAAKSQDGTPAAELSSIGKWALWLAHRGWHVFPLHNAQGGRCTCGDPDCERQAKHPRTQHGLLDATTDEAQIRQLWTRWPRANIGVAAGASSLVIVDVDGDDGAASLDALEANHGPLPATVRARTGRGQHAYFSAPVGVELTNSAGKLGRGLDVRAGNGYVVAPPSTHASGATYSWLPGMAPKDVSVAPVPDWLLALLTTDRLAVGDDIDLGSLFASEPANGTSDLERRTAYVRAAVDAEAAAVARASEGQRNDQLNRSAFALAQLVGGGELDEATVVRELGQAARHAGLKSKEIATTLQSAMTAGRKSPRRVPEPDERGHRGAARPWADAEENAASAEIVPIDAVGLPDGVQRGTDLATAHLLRLHHGQDLEHVAALGWLVFDGRRWTANDAGEVSRRLHAIGRGLDLHSAHLHAQAAREGDEDKQAELRSEAKAFAGWARVVQSEPGARRAAVVAESLLAGRIETYDADPWALNVLNGTVDLRSGEIRPHRRSDRLTKLAPVHYDAAAAAPVFDAFLQRVLPDADVRTFQLRALGYSLTGSTGEQCLFVLHGGGANGKSTLVETVRRILGDYAAHAQTDTFMRSGQRGPDNDLARLRGARFVTAIESGEGRRLDEERVKQLTGSDTVTARFLYREPFEFRPCMKIAIATNHKPAITGDDDAIWRRLRLVGFDVQIPEAERDAGLQEKLAAEAAGILAQLVRACLDWQQGGLRPPAAVLARTREWREDSDLIGNFVADECVAGDHVKVQSSVLYSAFTAWCKAQGVDAPTQKTFSDRLKRRGYEKKQTKAGAFWLRVGLPAAGERVVGDGS